MINNYITKILNEMLFISNDVCIIVGLIGFLLYIFGLRKSKNVPLLAWIISIIINIIGRVLLGV